MTANLTDPAENLVRLLRCPSVTPNEGRALETLQDMLAPLGFTVERPIFRDEGTPDVENLFAARGNGRHLAFAGHTDVVPTGEAADWRHPPFSGAIEDGEIYGRGAVDMKGAIACFVAALARLESAGRFPAGRISLLVTGDEEGPGINGTDKLLAHVAAKGERFDACLVGEPTNPQTLGEMIKIGRRGSLSGRLVLTGRQGHVAYPHLADNPTRAIAPVLDALLGAPLDDGTANFQPSNLEITSIDTGNPSANVVPARVTLAFNIRFNDRWSAEALKREIEDRVQRALDHPRHRQHRNKPIAHDLSWKTPHSSAFLTRDDALTRSLAAAVERVTGHRPELSTSGGTSDARFIKDYCPVVEFGLVGRTMHMSNERVSIADLEQLTAVYETFITGWFSADP